jgi:hypothetical protein
MIIKNVLKYRETCCIKPIKIASRGIKPPLAFYLHSLPTTAGFYLFSVYFIGLLAQWSSYLKVDTKLKTFEL